MKRSYKFLLSCVFYWIPLITCVYFSWKFALVFLIGILCATTFWTVMIAYFVSKHVGETMKLMLFINDTFDIPELKNFLKEKYPNGYDELNAEIEEYLKNKSTEK